MSGITEPDAAADEPTVPEPKPTTAPAKPKSVTEQFGIKTPEMPKPVAATAAAVKKPEIKAPEVTVGMTVYHKSFGEGTVAKFDGKYLTVKFEQGEKKFVYPMAFTGEFLAVR